jgi:archaellum component FlaG (FlaF/FlaG flagellin family)
MGYLGGLSLEGSAGAMFVEEASMTTETITAYVRNVGKTTIELDVVYVDGSEMSFSCDSMVIGEGELVEVTVNAPNATTFTSGKTYEVKLFAKDNTRLGFMIKCQ